MIFPRAKNPGLWTAVGAGAGTAVGTALGNSPIGLALGAALGLALALLAGRPGKRIYRTAGADKGAHSSSVSITTPYAETSMRRLALVLFITVMMASFFLFAVSKRCADVRGWRGRALAFLSQ
jgi:hypothetical protein